MTDDMIELTCPSCGEKVFVSENWVKVTCENCGALMTRDIPEEEDTVDYTEQRTKSTQIVFLTVLVIVSIIACVMRVAFNHVFNDTSYSYEYEYDENRETIDPWQGIEFEYSGRSGEGRVYVTGTNGYVYYDVDNNYNLKNGDKITVTAECSVYNLTSTKKTFVVNGFDELITDPNDLSNDALKLLQNSSMVQLNKNISESADGKQDDVMIMSRYGVYVLSNKSENMLYDIWELEWESSTGKYYTFYAVVRYRNIVVRDDGVNPISVNYDTVYYAGDYGNTSNFYGVDYDTAKNDRMLCGYGSIDELNINLLDKMETPMTAKTRVMAGSVD